MCGTQAEIQTLESWAQDFLSVPQNYKFSVLSTQSAIEPKIVWLDY